MPDPAPLVQLSMDDAVDMTTTSTLPASSAPRKPELLQGSWNLEAERQRPQLLPATSNPYNPFAVLAKRVSQQYGRDAPA